MRQNRSLFLKTFFASSVFLYAPLTLAATSDLSISWDVVGIAALFGAVGGVVYELTVLQGNVEWPHRTRADELPKTGYAHAGKGHLYDLGIFARIFIGAAAALIVFWAIPVPEPGIHLIAIGLVAGSTGTAIFRSLQDRLLAAVRAEKNENVKRGLKGLQSKMEQVQPPATAGGASAEKFAEVRGQVAALLKVAES